MESIIRRISIEDIQNNKYIDKVDNKPAICILQCGKVIIPLSETHFNTLIDSINQFTSIQVSCNECKYIKIDDHNINLMSCSLKALMSGENEIRSNRYNKNYRVNPMGSCQFGVKNKLADIDPYMQDALNQLNNSNNKSRNIYTEEEIKKSKKINPGNIRRVTKL